MLRSVSEVRLKLVVAALAASAYSAIGLVRHWHFGSSAYDLGIFDQMVWHLSRFEAPASSIHGLSNMFGDHFSPIWMLLAPLYWLRPSPDTLIVAQGVIVAASIPLVWLFLERRLPKTEAALLAIAYALFWGLQRGVQFDVHELMFAPVLIAWMLLAIDRGTGGLKPAGYVWPALLLCLVKEDQIPLVAAAAALAAWRSTSRARVTSAVVAVLALVWFVAVVKVIIPSLSDHGSYSVGSAFSQIAAHPLTSIPTIINPTKLNTLLLWLLPFVFLPLRSSYALLLVPLALERFLSASPNHWGTSFHYSLPVAPIVAMAAGDGLAKLRSVGLRSVGLKSVGLKSVGLGIAGLCLLLSAFLPGRQPVWKLFSPAFYEAVPFASIADRALAMIPDEASVAAQSAIVPHIRHRERMYILGGASQGNRSPDVVIAAPELVSSWPLADGAAVRAEVDRYLTQGYIRRFDEGGWVVLSK
ncbi:MAG: DUF2079 domain-containing protein [Acidobacteria bacterium]|nr:MAG: DUF2079 domain-containing protein [Acidobacteriota bacterium]